MSRLNQIPEYEDFFKTLKLALNEFAFNHNVSTYDYFANFLGFTSDNKNTQMSNLLNSYTGKYLKSNELLMILDRLDTEQVKIVLDYIARRKGLIVSYQADKKNNTELEKMFLSISKVNGDLATQYFQAIQDGEIDEKEKKQLNDIMYQFRSLLKGFEYDL